MPERMIRANGVELCTEPFGDPDDPPVLLIMGGAGSMLWWDEAFCRMLAEGGRFVIRYDHRDTGRSTTYLPAAHVVGVSMGGALAQVLALDFPDRVLSLTLISTSLAVGGRRALPPSTEEFARFVSTAELDRSDPDSVVDYLVEYSRVLAGRRSFDEAAMREFVRRDIERARDFAAAQNHDLMSDGGGARGPLSSIAVPTLVIHGTADPMFPPGHGEALADEIPDARLLLLDGAGHGLDRADRDTVAT